MTQSIVYNVDAGLDIYVSCLSDLLTTSLTNNLFFVLPIYVCFLIGSNLSLEQKNAEVNVSTSQEFTVDCLIRRESSKQSEFQVMWFWQEAFTGNGRRLIFASYRNSTLQAFERSDQLRFSRPLRHNYSLTVSKPAVVDTGVFFCMVEEWLPSLSHGWRKVTTQKSGYLSVNVYLPGQPLFEYEHSYQADA